MLITVAHLAAAIASPTPPTVLDVRWQLGRGSGRDEYLDTHVPTAVFVDLDTELAAPPGPAGRHPLPDPHVFGAAMRRHGVRADRTVVVYDAVGGAVAARAWWLLRHHGHPDVRLLDGGLTAWLDEGRPVEGGDAHPEPGDFRPVVPGLMPVVDAAAAADVAREGVLLDARAPERYAGEHEPVDPVAGHVPGAVNAPTTENVGPDARFLDADRLRQRFAALGATPGRRVATYCGSGVNASHQVFALALAGVEAALYPGSWSEWVADPARPVATGR